MTVAMKSVYSQLHSEISECSLVLCAWRSLIQ